jgi:hypothetical protein
LKEAEVVDCLLKKNWNGSSQEQEVVGSQYPGVDEVVQLVVAGEMRSKEESLKV